MKKRIIALILSALLMVLTFSSCSSSKRTAVNISGAQISEGVYTYYYDYVYSSREKLGITGDDEEKQLREKTTELLKEYVAINSMAAQLDVSLSYTLKAQAANDTDCSWDLFGKHYTSLGVTKQDLNKVMTNRALKTALLDYYYGENSTVSPTDTKKLKKAFTEKYIGMNVVAASLTTTDNLGNTIVLDTYELSNIREIFSDMKSKLNQGADISAVYSDYITNLDLVGTQSLDTYIITESSVSYDEDFFSKVSKLEYNKAAVIEYEDTIYLAYRVDISDDEQGYFVTYKNAVLEDLCLSKLEEKIKAKALEYTLLKEHSSVTRGIRDTVAKKYK